MFFIRQYGNNFFYRENSKEPINQITYYEAYSIINPEYFFYKADINIAYKLLNIFFLSNTHHTPERWLDFSDYRAVISITHTPGSTFK